MSQPNDKTIRESVFTEMQTIWGFELADPAIFTQYLFLKFRCLKSNMM